MNAHSVVGKYALEPFGDALEALMKHRRMTFRGLAAASGLSAGYLNHLVHGNRPAPAEDVIVRLATALRVDADHFHEVRLRRVMEELRSDPDAVLKAYKRMQS